MNIILPWLVPLLWTLITVDMVRRNAPRDVVAWAVVGIFNTIAWYSTYSVFIHGGFK